MFQCITQPRNGLIYYASELKNVFPDIRVQLNDQLKTLDVRLETQQAVVSEFQDIFRRRADIEASYSKELDRLAKYISNRHKEQKQKRDAWPLFSSMAVWEQLVAQTKRRSRDHAALAEIYANQIAQRTNQINDDLQRVYRRCREIGYEIHEEVLKVLHELHTAMKTHQTYQAEFRQAESKFQVARKQFAKLEQSVPKEKQAKHKKFKFLKKEYEKRETKYNDALLNSTKARNEYLLCKDAANSSIQKYFVDDLSDLIDCMDFGFHQSLNRAIMMHVSGMDQHRRSLQQDMDNLAKVLASMDSRLDKQKFIEGNNNIFMIPKKFEYSPVRSDELEVSVQKVVLEELQLRRQKLFERLSNLKADSEEIWKSMETAEKTLADMVGCKDYDTTRFFVEEERASLQRDPEAILMKQRSDRKETEDFYLNKFREYVLNSNRIARLQAKYEHICSTLGDKSIQSTGEGVLTLTRRPNAARRRRIGNNSRHGGQPKLFGGSLEEYLEETNQDIPSVLRSCVRVINVYGLHHHGIFRVSGSQVEINNFRDAFERGEDPLAEMTDASDINSVAGLLKLYLRELREPIFPIQYFDHFMELAQLESKHEFVFKVKEVVLSWPRPVFIVVRYLFAFLNHLSEFSDENMMDPYNLAICFGPTLVPIPEDRDQVQYQNLVNELIKNFIIFHEDIFPVSVQGAKYEKYISVEPEDMGEAPNEHAAEDNDSEIAEDDSVFRDEKDDVKDLSIDLFGKSEVMEAHALYDFKARSSREVNFHKGDTILLYKQVSNDWWRGAVGDKEGLIPDKYITIKMRGEDDRDRLESYRSTDEPLRERSMSTSYEPSTYSRSHSVTSVDPAAPLVSVGAGLVSAASLNSVSDASVTPRQSSSPSATTVITLPAAAAFSASRESSLSRSDRSASELRVSPQRELTRPRPTSLVSNTHIIRVSGPAPASADEPIVLASTPVQSGESSSEYHFHLPTESHVISEPISPLASAKNRSSSASQESLASTGSNRELKHQLDSTIAQVEAFAKEIEKRKQSASALPAIPAASGNPPRVSGARPKMAAATPRVAPAAEGVLLKQSSWGSRENMANQEAGDTSANFVQSRSLWEKRTATPEDVTPDAGVRGGFRSNRDFWQQKATAKQTPDLVLDLPATAVDTSTPVVVKTSPKDPSPTPVPKPRTLAMSDDHLDEMSKNSRKVSAPAAMSRPTPLQASATPTARPQVRVKPQVQTRKLSLTQDESETLKE